ncbi:MAG: hypothetical protein NWS40_03050 [Crocinitomicaceae bacterium]|jgi:hypothetical protein|nr:hypothetical protein [Crocinitomicaceae bacterium]MDP4866168.1 hypothetical protein [Crocinitomicaceae bacterium]MDP5011409.1 hypothetical protein [Crocinitomicaceae bacterium]
MKYLLCSLFTIKVAIPLLVLVFPMLVHAQNSSEINFSSDSLVLNEATELYRDSLVVISLTKVNYDSPQDGIYHERINYHFENLSSKNITISFNRIAVYTPSTSAKGDMNQLEIKLAPHSFADCASHPRDKRFYTFSKDLKNTIRKELQIVQILNIEVR